MGFFLCTTLPTHLRHIWLGFGVSTSGHCSWDYTNENDKGGIRRLALLSGCAGLFGLLLGLFAVRFTLVAVTSLVGTLMISAGAIGLAQQWQPQMYEAVLNHPQALGIAGGTFLLGSIILQTLLTRPDKAATAPAKS